MKNLIFILCLSLLLFNCSIDDDSVSEVDTRLFIEKMAGSIWTNNPDGDILDTNSNSRMLIFKFNNDINHPWDKWENNNLYGCWKREFSRNEGYDYEIIEHSDTEFRVKWSCPDRYVFLNPNSSQTYYIRWEFNNNQLIINGMELYKYNGSNLSELNQCINYNELTSQDYGIIQVRTNGLVTVEDNTLVTLEPYPCVEYNGDLYLKGRGEIGDSYIGLSIKIPGEFSDFESPGNCNSNVTLIEGTGSVCQAQFEYAYNLNTITITEVNDSWITGNFEFELVTWYYPGSCSLYEGYFHILRQ